eukprot:PhM_4_TR13817/c0_g1_i1/m.18944/K05864/PPID, CYPD; peptidyl-prolyl isomerase D
MSTAATHCFLDFTIDGHAIGRIVVELFTSQLPRTCENFAALCRGTHAGMTYAGTPIHRVVRGFIVQGGDITNKDGTGGMSIYGGTFNDEGFVQSHNAAGLLSMATTGPNSNLSQFFFTCAAARHLNGKHVCFGAIVHGMSVLRQIERVTTESGDAPAVSVVVSACGVLTQDEIAAPRFGVPTPSDGDVFEDIPHDANPGLTVDDAATAAEALKKIGNAAFAQKKWAEAMVKYDKAVRYTDAPVETGLLTCLSESLLTIRLASLSNSVQCLINLGNFEEAEKRATAVIEAVAGNNNNNKNNNNNGSHTKCLFRRAFARVQKKDLEGARQDLLQAKSFSRNDNDTENIVNLLTDVEARLSAQQEILKAKMKNMFS